MAPTAGSCWSPSDRPRHEAFARRRLATARLAPRQLRRARTLHGLLLAAALSGAHGARGRAPALTPDGTAVAYSLKLDGRCPPPFRMVVEPGLDRPVADHVAAACALAATALEQLGWSAAQEPLAAALAPLLPREAHAMDDWWGGIWLGCSAGADALDLRVYVNLRSGDVRARWRRAAAVARALGAVGLDELAPYAAPHGAPTGVCLVVRDGQLAGMRLYVAIERPLAARLLTACPPRFRARRARELCTAFHAAFGAPAPQGASVGYDLRAGGGLERVKLELCAERLDARASARVLPWLQAQASTLGLPAAELARFAEDFAGTLGGAASQYVTFGVRDDVDHVTAYCRPTGGRTTWPSSSS